MVHTHFLDSPLQSPGEGLAVKVNPRSEIGRFGLIVRIDRYRGGRERRCECNTKHQNNKAPKHHSTAVPQHHSTKAPHQRIKALKHHALASFDALFPVCQLTFILLIAPSTPTRPARCRGITKTMDYWTKQIKAPLGPLGLCSS